MHEGFYFPFSYFQTLPKNVQPSQTLRSQSQQYSCQKVSKITNFAKYIMKKLFSKLFHQDKCKPEGDLLPVKPEELTITLTTKVESCKRIVRELPFLAGQHVIQQIEGWIKAGHQKAKCYIQLTNYKIALSNQKEYRQAQIIPLGHILKVSCQGKENDYQHVIILKNGLSINFYAAKNYQAFIHDLKHPKSIKDSFAAYHHKANNKQSGLRAVPYIEELIRQRAPLYTELKIVQNKEGEICKTYGILLSVPSKLEDEEIQKCSKFRSKERIPALTYYWERCQKAIFRSSQNLVGIVNKRSSEDEKMLQLIGEIGTDASKGKTCHIYDARPKFNALGNKLAGKGFQYEEYYQNCQIFFLDIDNIHAVRDSYLLINEAVDSDQKFFHKVAESKWLDIVAMVLIGATKIVESMESGFNVLVHCSDGWDRTSQLCALAQLMVDPYFRSFQGFRVLIEKDWLYFGHMFATRNGARSDEKEEQCSPIFTQFLDCVHQIWHTYPCEFEYNLKLLVFLQYHYKAQTYGEFLFDCELERRPFIGELPSIWNEIDGRREEFANVFYAAKKGQGLKIWEGDKMHIWEQVWLVRERCGKDQSCIFEIDWNSQNRAGAQQKTQQKLKLLH